MLTFPIESNGIKRVGVNKKVCRDQHIFGIERERLNHSDKLAMRNQKCEACKAAIKHQIIQPGARNLNFLLGYLNSPKTIHARTIQHCITLLMIFSMLIVTVASPSTLTGLLTKRKLR